MFDELLFRVNYFRPFDGDSCVEKFQAEKLGTNRLVDCVGWWDLTVHTVRLLEYMVSAISCVMFRSRIPSETGTKLCKWPWVLGRNEKRD